MARSRSRSSWWLSAVLLLAACAHGVGSEPPAGNHATAQRIYMVAEERYAAGDFEAAVDLMRHALLQLPPAPEHDHLRHELILRMGHTQLRASAASGQAAPLVDAQQMLTRYLERHEALFGENAVARAERGEVYELLFLVEQQLEPVSIDLGDEASDEALAAASPSVPAISDEPSAVPEPEPIDACDGALSVARVGPWLVYGCLLDHRVEAVVPAEGPGRVCLARETASRVTSAWVRAEVAAFR